MELHHAWNKVWHKGEIKTAFATPTPQNLDHVRDTIAKHAGMVSASDTQTFKDLFLFVAVKAQSDRAVGEALKAGANPDFKVVLEKARTHKMYPAKGGPGQREEIAEISDTAANAANNLGNHVIKSMIEMHVPMKTEPSAPRSPLRVLRNVLGFEVA